MEKVLKILTVPSPLVSVIIPVYNGGDYLAEAINSVLSQSYPNIEIIVVNDGSDDEDLTEKVALSFGKRIRYFSKKNGGVSSALNFGLKKMKGDFFSWLSHDDVYRENKIFKQVKYLLLHPEVSLVYGNYELQNEKGVPFFCVTPNRDYPSIYPLFHLFRRQTNICTALIRKEVFQRIGYFKESSTTTQDYEFLFQCFINLQCSYLDEIFVNTRIHPKQGSQTIKSHIDNAEKMWMFFFSSLSNEWYQKFGGKKNFLKDSINYFKNTPYLKVASFCEKLEKASFLQMTESAPLALISQDELQDFEKLTSIQEDINRKENINSFIFFWTKNTSIPVKIPPEKKIRIITSSSFEDFLRELVNELPLLSYVCFFSGSKIPNKKNILKIIKKSENKLSFVTAYSPKKYFNCLDVRWENMIVRLDYLDKAKEDFHSPQALLLRLEEITKIQYEYSKKPGWLELTHSKEELIEIASRVYGSSILRARQKLTEDLSTYLFYTHRYSTHNSKASKFFRKIKQIGFFPTLKLMFRKLREIVF